MPPARHSEGPVLRGERIVLERSLAWLGVCLVVREAQWTQAKARPEGAVSPEGYRNWSDYYRAIGDNPFECSMFGCLDPALYIVAAQPCGTGCDHMHGVPQPLCGGHLGGREILETTGD